MLHAGAITREAEAGGKVMTLPRSFADRFLYASSRIQVASSRIQVSDLFPQMMSNEHRLNDQTKTKACFSFHLSNYRHMTLRPIIDPNLIVVRSCFTHGFS
jgi:hypothetical protein